MLDDSLADGHIIYTTAKSDTEKSGKTWVSEQVSATSRNDVITDLTSGLQVWGFEQVNGEKRYTRHIYFEGPKGEVVTIRLVYDYRMCPARSSPVGADIVYRGTVVDYKLYRCTLLETTTRMYETMYIPLTKPGGNIPTFLTPPSSV